VELGILPSLPWLRQKLIFIVNYLRVTSVRAESRTRSRFGHGTSFPKDDRNYSGLISAPSAVTRSAMRQLILTLLRMLQDRVAGLTLATGLTTLSPAAAEEK
jgi:hypothetical protein